ncbi:hypothetical protein [uncultured Nostoc sp.]|uniref:hypothetical protein n=1 Tax=uncultured Nostoc sp. TaxID=340711 RepID=UPI0035CCA844
MKLGSVEHKELFCRSFTESYKEYEPEYLPWSDLDDKALTLLRSIPFWDKVDTERHDRYGIELPERQPIQVPQNIEPIFTRFGFEECLDTFFAYGLFVIAREANVFPESIFTIFDPIIDEETRHIVFFVNTYTQIHRGQGFTPLRSVKTL